ncbi:MAG: hypothetical protein HY291_22710 [Planctomycetes bacterium]|nr:hypothetical protein [Planctomycetota bacterium]
MRVLPLALCALMLLAAPVRALDDRGKDLVEAKITLPNGELYMRGATDPVSELVVTMTLTNRSSKENRGKETITVTRPSYITEAERKKLEEKRISDGGTLDEYKKKLDDFYGDFVKNKTKTETVEQTPVNPKSFGIAYIEPALGPNDLVEFAIYRLPDEGAPADAKPKKIDRDMPVEHTVRADFAANKYLAAGETSEPYTLPAGKFYRITEPGNYTIKAVIRTIGDSGKPDKVVESNEEKFRVMPYKVVSRKIDNLVEAWDDYERGHPDFNFMIYQLQRAASWQEIYYVQRIMVRGIERWEWHRLCTVAQGSTPQVAQVTPTKFAILSLHAKGDAGLYTIDFSKVDPAVTSKILEVKEGNVPKLKVEGGNVSAE